MSHPEVQRRLDISLRSLLAMTDKFLVAIMSSVDQIPYVCQPCPSRAPSSRNLESLSPRRGKEMALVGGTSTVGIVIIKSSTPDCHGTIQRYFHRHHLTRFS